MPLPTLKNADYPFTGNGFFSVTISPKLLSNGKLFTFVQYNFTEKLKLPVQLPVKNNQNPGLFTLRLRGIDVKK